MGQGPAIFIHMKFTLNMYKQSEAGVPMGLLGRILAPMMSFTMTSAGCVVRYTLKNFSRWFPSSQLECKPFQVTGPGDV